MAVDEIAQVSAGIAAHNSQVHFKCKVESNKSGLRLDNSKIRGLGWSVNTSLDEGVLNTIKALS